MSKNNSFSSFFELIKNNGIKYIDFRFTDYLGTWIHITHSADCVGEEELIHGVNFDGSSVKGWKAINDSDMVLLPKPETAFIDPFTTIPTLVVVCDIFDPKTGGGYSKDPRYTAIKAEQYLKDSKIGDTAYFGPEPEFFVFENVKYHANGTSAYHFIDSNEFPANSNKDIDGGNLARRVPIKSAYFAPSPIDMGQDLRSEMMESLREVGIVPVLHHHEVANAQYEIGFKFSTLKNTADNVQKFKYVIHNICESYGKTSTFMPKPIFGDNGSGMHVHQSIWKDGKNLFVGDKYSGLSDMALYYIGGIIKHAKAINAFANPTTNSYKRLVPGYEAPVLLAYSAKNRSASIRIPYVANEKARRIEARFPDPASNPYLLFSALLMAGLDGIKNKIHPGEPKNEDLYHLPEKQIKKIPAVARNLSEALDSLDRDREFLLEGDVFTNEQIDSYIEIKRAEVKRYEQMPHPVEFEMYYNC